MLSVLMATHNGADTIERTLAAMSELAAPVGGWKFVVVNNASTDDSEARILKWCDRLPLQYLVEPRLGKSHAMNTALDHAEGDLIIMTDDDVLPERDWLTEWRRMADSYPTLSVFGGAIVPEFEQSPPAWLIDDGCFTVLYAKTPDQPEGEIAPLDISGPNLAIRTSIRDQGWRFGEGFMIGQNGLMGEDSDLVTRLAEAGHKVGFAPTARVRHIVQKSQMSWRWIHRRFIRHGRTQFMAEDVRWDAATHRPVFRFPWWRISKSMESLVHLTLAALRRDAAALSRQSRILSYHLGALSQAWSLVRSHK